jgi:ABC-2 type transport system permease protein
VILLLTFLWVQRTDVRFEEASLGRAERAAHLLESPRGHLVRSRDTDERRARRPPFRLGAKGPPYFAIYWKNLISVGRFGLRWLLPVFGVTAGIALMTAWSREDGRAVVPATIGMLAATFAGLLAFLGPVLVRSDLRIDLLHVDWLKSLPIPGWNVLLGEILAPVAILAFSEWVLLAVAAFSFPEMGQTHWSAYRRAMVALGAAQLLPCFSLVGILIQNAAVLIMPGWVQLGKERQRGVEAMGQRLISMAGGLLAFLFAVVPAFVVFLIGFTAGYWAIGFAVIPFAALMASLALIFEAGLGIAWLGRIFDKFDASVELNAVGAE